MIFFRTLLTEIYARQGFTLSNVSNIDHNYELSFHIGLETTYKIKVNVTANKEDIILDGEKVDKDLMVLIVSKFPDDVFADNIG